MDELQQYIEGEFRQDLDEIAELGDLVAQILPTFSNFFNETSGQWPYEISAPAGRRLAETSSRSSYSYSTNSMIAHMISVTLWGAEGSVLVPAIRADDRLTFKKTTRYSTTRRRRNFGIPSKSPVKPWHASWEWEMAGRILRRAAPKLLQRPRSRRRKRRRH
jgi:hypothetical protein